MTFKLSKIRVSWIVAFILWISAFTIYRTLLSHVLYYFDQHHLFVYTHQYIAHTLAGKGCMALCCDFLGQFFHQLILGSAILATILTGIYLLADFFLKRLSCALETRKGSWAALIRWMRWLQLPLLLALCVFFTFTTSNDTPAAHIWAFLITGVLALVALLFKDKRTETKNYGNKPVIIGVVCAIVFLFVAGYQFRKHYSIPERIMLKTQQYAENEDWDDVLEYTAAYMRSGHNNLLIAYYRSMALGEKKQLVETAKRALQGSSDPADYYLLEMNEKALFFPWNSNSRETEYGGLIYERLGLINEAQHWETEALQVFGITAPRLIHLAEYAIATGRPDVAEHFIEPLRHTLYFSEKANELESIKSSGKVEGLANAFVHADDSVSAPFSNVFHLAPQLDYALRVDSTNTLAREYQKTLEIITPTK